LEKKGCIEKAAEKIQKHLAENQYIWYVDEWL